MNVRYVKRDKNLSNFLKDKRSKNKRDSLDTPPAQSQSVDLGEGSSSS